MKEEILVGGNISDSHVPNGRPLDPDGGPGDGAEEEPVDLDIRQVALQLVHCQFLEAAEDVEVLEG